MTTASHPLITQDETPSETMIARVEGERGFHHGSWLIVLAFAIAAVVVIASGLPPRQVDPMSVTGVQ